MTEHICLFHWGHIFGKGMYVCRCGRIATPLEAERAAKAEAETRRVRDLRFGVEPGAEQGKLL